MHYSREDWGLLRVEDNEGGRTERPRAVLASAESRQEKKDARLGDMGGNETGLMKRVRRRDTELDGILESDLRTGPLSCATMDWQFYRLRCSIKGDPQDWNFFSSHETAIV